MKTRLFFLVLSLSALALNLRSEGTKQIRPFTTAQGELCIDKSRNDFAFYDGAEEFRLNIFIANPSEKICFGFGKVSLPDSTFTIAFRIKDPSGNVVYGPDFAPPSGTGYIDDYDQAVAGPFLSAGGYNPLVYQPVSTGNYYMEFYYPPTSGVYDEAGRYQLRYFDITVVNASGNPVNGRVWSKAWQFNCGPVEAPPTDSRFYGNVFVLSDDSVITRLNCNGFVGGTFSISSNETGCATTGNMQYDRKSKEGFYTYPQYKVFLNDPDSLVFPTRTAQPGIVPPVTISKDCSTGSVDFGVQVDHDGTVELFIDVDPTVSPDNRDVRMIENVLKNPGGNGLNTIHWNGKDNTSTQVPNGTQLICYISFISGLTHLPIYDIEFNDAGYMVQQIRPPGAQLTIYWDDSEIPGGDSNPVTGCQNLTGCHTWDSVVGNMNTINSWWFVVQNNLGQIPFTIKKIPGIPENIIGPSSICCNTAGVAYSISPEPSSDEYFWSYSGSGVTLVENGPVALLSFSDSATTGILSVYGKNDDCGAGPPRETTITVNPIPVVSLSPLDTVCYNSVEFILTGGLPLGGDYRIDGITSTTFQPLTETPGTHEVIYTFNTPEGCSSSDSTLIVVKKDQECAPIVYFPNAFSPNEDGLNDTFKPVTLNVFKYLIEIFDRSGGIIFSSNDPEEGWDGKFKGQYCMPGVYIYKATYQETLIIDNPKTLKGTVMLVR